MSCGVPCLSTNVGEASKIIGKTGWVINNKSASALSSKLVEITIDGKGKIEKLKNLCRERIIEYYSIERMIAKYKKLYSGL
jgi:glycosyltransferase involved in cell wall biosynthesis